MTDSTDHADLTWGEKLAALRRVASYRPTFTAGLIILGGFVAALEGVGLGFIHPIIEVAQAEGPVDSGGPVLETFLQIYTLLGIPFELGYLLVGVTAVMTVRYTLSFLVAWLKAYLATAYESALRTRAFDDALGARVGYFDAEGSDDILNAIISETRFSGQVIEKGVATMERLFLVGMYLAVMLYITPLMTGLAVGLLGTITVVLRVGIEPAVTVGTRVAEANERVQTAVQAGTQGIRDVKLFRMSEELFENFQNAIDQYRTSEVAISRNEAAITNFYQLAAAVTIFVLIYVGFVFSGLELGELGIFLIAMFQLAPRISTLNSQLYSLEGALSHLVRTHEFLDNLDDRQETGGDRSVSAVDEIAFEDVTFDYTDDERVLDGISFDVARGEFVAFVGQSGAGKSTIVSLLARLYEPDDGEIRADGTPIEEFALDEWRGRIAVVRQQPFIFDDTLARNVTVGNREATHSEVEAVCEIAMVEEFVDELPNGYDSQLGDDGVRLSGGQRQRIAVARALLTDADFLILDEATSDLDSGLERDLQASIESMDREVGMIAIAHRLSTVRNANRIHTLEDGRIVESGPHEELLEETGSYAKLYEMQSRQ